jgi:uncharacterized ferritin-like protein (DUF455 family)
MLELREASLAILASTDAQTKVSQLLKLFTEYQEQRVTLNVSLKLDSQNLILPGRPVKPELVLPKLVPKRRMDTLEGRAGLLHSLAHIEFNAMNLALDAIWRFPEMPKEYSVSYTHLRAHETG